MSKQRITSKQAQSLIGSSVSLFFVGVGLFSLIPATGAFGVLWTLFASVMCILNIMNALPKKGVASGQTTVEDNRINNSTPAKNSQSSPEERLLSLMELYKNGLIEKEEYDKKRKSIIEYL